MNSIMPEPNPNLPVPVTSEYPLLEASNMQQMLQIFRDNVGTASVSKLDLPRLKATAGGSTTWLIQTIDGEDSAKEITGIILSWRNGRIYWRKTRGEGGGKTPPDCVSQDGFTGEGDPGGVCADCPMAKFGSAQKGRGQACKQVRQILLIRPGEVLPYLLTVPPTSLKNAGQYFLGLFGRQVPFWGVTTRIRLEKAQSEGGIDYSKMLFSLGRMLTPAEITVLKPFQENMRDLLKPVTIDAKDYEAEEEGEPKAKPYLPGYTRIDREPGGGDDIPY